MVVAKTDRMHRLLVDCFKNHLLQKEYLALLHGVLKEKTGRIVYVVIATHFVGWRKGMR
jgi:23S rRNA pseudouridine1911/1915/1917 synthase